MWETLGSVTFPEDIFPYSPLWKPQISNVKVLKGNVVHKLRCDKLRYFFGSTKTLIKSIYVHCL